MQRPKIFYGWWIALSYAVMNFYWSGTLLAGFSVFFNPIRESFGLSATATTAIISIRMGAAAIGSPLVGALFDRIGPRPLILVATLTTGGGMALLATAHSTWLFILSFSIASVGFAIFIAGTGPATMANWFVRNRGKAISIALGGAGIGSFIVPLLVWIEGEWGWRTSLIMVVIGLIALGVPLSMVLRHRPEQYGLRPDGDPPVVLPESALVGEAVPAAAEAPHIEGLPFEVVMRNRSFWLLVTAQAILGLGTGAVTLFLIPHLEDQGLSKTTAGFAVTMVGAVGLGGTLVVGWLSDFMDRRQLMAVSYAMVGGGVALLAFTSSTWQIVPFAVLFGIGARSSFPVLSGLLADYFGRAHFGKVQGVQLGVFTAASAVGAIIGAVVRDATESFTPILAVYASLSVLSLALLPFAGRPAQEIAAAKEEPMSTG